MLVVNTTLPVLWEFCWYHIANAQTTYTELTLTCRANVTCEACVARDGTVQDFLNPDGP